MTLDIVHRFSDPEYAWLSLAMRTGEPLRTGGKPSGERLSAASGTASGGVVDALVGRDQIRIYLTDAERTQALAVLTAANIIGGQDGVLVMADTREQVAALNGAIRDRLVAVGRVQDIAAITTQAGERIGVGDRVATRRNDRALQVANRDTWTLTAIAHDGTATLTGSTGQQAVLPPSYVRQHLELAYATTSYGAQGEASSVGHLLLGEQTGAAGAYVGMTRGRDINIAHLVAESIEDARAQWVGAFSRDRADLGPAHAARVAAEQADNYAPQRPQAQVLAEVHRAWTTEADLSQRLAAAHHLRDQLAQVVSIRAGSDPQLARLDKAAGDAGAAATHARIRADQAAASIKADAGRIAGALRGRWDHDYPAASAAAETIRGSGRFGRHRGEVRQARAHLQGWALTWRPVLGQLPAGVDELAAAMPFTATSALHQAISSHAQHTAAQAHPDHRHSSSPPPRAPPPRRMKPTTPTLLRRGHCHGGSPGSATSPTPTTPPGALPKPNTQPPNSATRSAEHRNVSARCGRSPRSAPRRPGGSKTERENWQAQRAEAQEVDRQALWLAATTRRRVRPEDLASPAPDRGPDHGFGR